MTSWVSQEGKADHVRSLQNTAASLGPEHQLAKSCAVFCKIPHCPHGSLPGMAGDSPASGRGASGLGDMGTHLGPKSTTWEPEKSPSAT